MTTKKRRAKSGKARKGGKRRKGRTAAQKAATRKMIAANRARRGGRKSSGGSKSRKRRSGAKRRSTKKRTKRAHAVYSRDLGGRVSKLEREVKSHGQQIHQVKKVVAVHHNAIGSIAGAMRRIGAPVSMRSLGSGR
jgi:hypothetical protein